MKAERLDVPMTIDIDILQPLMFGREPTEELIQVRLPVIKRGIEVYKGMPGQDSAVKFFEV